MFSYWTAVAVLTSLTLTAEARPHTSERSIGSKDGSSLANVMMEAGDADTAILNQQTSDTLLGLVLAGLSASSPKGSSPVHRQWEFLGTADVQDREHHLSDGKAPRMLTRRGDLSERVRGKRLENPSFALDAISCCKGDIFCMLRADCLHEDYPY
ncbi:hypothetical protein LSH36_860g00001 [Paralvinella palmiformis]|uniref:Uncharacterized protein n=1 Tax=Paralvinella palmiformis TaxID=53620 RepID=A0AAD9J063_9ANNE|nr:hypothetical protein LSH36_860g00001 [Paralvinella palmiformis]